MKSCRVLFHCSALCPTACRLADLPATNASLSTHCDQDVEIYDSKAHYLVTDPLLFLGFIIQSSCVPETRFWNAAVYGLYTTISFSCLSKAALDILWVGTLLSLI